MAQLIKIKLKGSTLVEVTVASVIIVVVFLLASTLIANLWKSGPSNRKLAGHSFLQKISNQYIDNEDLNIDESLPDGLKFEQKQELYEGYDDVNMITLTLRETGSDELLDELIFLCPINEETED